MKLTAITIYFNLINENKYVFEINVHLVINRKRTTFWSEKFGLVYKLFSIKKVINEKFTKKDMF
jgi:hypothetical protein